MRLRARRALILLTALVLGFAARSDGEAVFLSRVVWSEDQPMFGGWSGLEVTPDGAGFTAVSDRGRIVTGRFRRTAGRIAAIEAGPLHRLGDTADGWFRNDIRDAEGLAIGPGGRVFVAFEVVRRVLAYGDTAAAQAVRLPLHRDFIGLGSNEGLEALAIDAGGALYTLPERVFNGADGTTAGGPFPVYRFDGGWTLFGHIPGRGGFLPVGADIGPEGRFYLLERRLWPHVGFATRVRRFELRPDGGRPDGRRPDGRQQDALAGETTLLTTRPGTHDNLEGLAIWRDTAGRLRLTMLADDNFGRFQKTEFVEYLLPE